MQLLISYQLVKGSVTSIYVPDVLYSHSVHAIQYHVVNVIEQSHRTGSPLLTTHDRWKDACARCDET